ncbi:hypothetical protein [Brevibacillus centrosporus]|uniref:hypothetical protein n=1 Tax=Brevibacillus centrosporus TaxID=54910 RepID=UPI002E1E3E66|nr:hypothetical protein [Brevibacillus centrosporus]
MLLSEALDFLNRLQEIQAQFREVGYPNVEEKGYFSVIRWHEEDIKQALINQGYLSNRQNVKKVLESRTGKTLQDRSVEEGWLILEDCLVDVEGLQARKNKNS